MPENNYIFRVSNGDLLKSYVEYDHRTIKTIVSETTNKIRNFTYTDKHSGFVWTEENYNEAPPLYLNKMEKKSISYSHPMFMIKLRKKLGIFSCLIKEQQKRF